MKHRPTCSGKDQRRTGSLFHYFMMYLFLTSVFLTVGGVCLHTILKADRTDTIVASHLKQLWRLDIDLRFACSAATSVDVEGGQLTISDTKGETQTWAVDGSTLLMTSQKDGVRSSGQRYSFARGAEINIRTDGAMLVVSVSDPRALSTAKRESSASADGHTQAKVTEIVVARPPGSADGSNDE